MQSVEVNPMLTEYQSVEVNPVLTEYQSVEVNPVLTKYICTCAVNIILICHSIIIVLVAQTSCLLCEL